MFPIRDNNPTYSTPVVTYALIAVNTLVFLFCSMQPDHGEELIWKYGFEPAGLTNDADVVRAEIDKLARPRQILVRDRFGRLRTMTEEPRSYARAATALPAELKIFTCMFMHGGWMHLIGNMLYLYIFGNNIEDRLGHGLFVIFYLVTGVIGTLLHTFIDSAGLVPLVGASGAISGVLGAYILIHPHARIDAVVPIGWYITTVALPAWIFLGIYALMQVLNALPSLSRINVPGGAGVAYWAHIGGFAAGLALIKVLPARRTPRRLARPRPNEDSGYSVFGP